MKGQKSYIISALIILIGLTFIIRLFLLQVVLVDYKLAARDNTVKKEYIIPYRGHISDRNGKMLANNAPVFDLYITVQKIIDEDKPKICKLLEITSEEYDNILQEVKKEKAYSPLVPMLFVRHISMREYAAIQDKFDFQGYSFEVRTERSYPQQVLAHGLGYIAEIGKNELERDDYYISGENIGKTGIEKYYEKTLRGKRGIKLSVVDVKGVQRAKFRGGAYDSAAVAGIPLVSGIDLELQMYVEKLLENKRGAAVAIEPATGEILCFISNPAYNPETLSGRGYSQNMRALQGDRNRPLFNRAAQASYPPGSTFKPFAALIALQQGVITPTQTIGCFGRLKKITVGDHITGYLDMESAIKHSSNIYFGKLFMRTVQQNEKKNWFEDSQYGLDKWKKYVNSFGIGMELSTDIYGEKKGFVPDSKYYNKKFRRWDSETVFSLGIGQGELGITPLQSANSVAIIANRGYYYTPHIIKEIGDKDDSYEIDEKYLLKNRAMIDKKHYDVVINAMEAVVESGTARRSKIEDIAICGKTGTVQNPHGEDHSTFIAFAPKNNPSIAISVYVENAGGGSAFAAPIASLAIEKYIRGHISEKRKFLEQQILSKNLIDQQ